MAVRALVEALDGAGVPRERFLSEAGLSSAQLSDATTRLALPDYRRTLRAALVTSGDPALGLQLGAHAKTASLDVLGYLVEQSGTLREALANGAQYVRLLTNGPALEIVEEGTIATLRCSFICDESTELQLTAEFGMTMLLRFVRQFVGDSAVPRHAFFSYPAPAHREAYTRVFGGSEVFSHAFVGLELPRAWLDAPQHKHRSPELQRLLRARADQLLAENDRDTPLAERVERWLSSQPLLTRPTMEDVARDLGMSARSLRRRLTRDGVLYSELVEDARAARAKQLLADPRRSIQDAAYTLGFETPSAFSRAFKRWTGAAPTAYRAHPR
jgi:AraC-like DNA-binding protein